jgi:hypothetical protein
MPGGTYYFHAVAGFAAWCQEAALKCSKIPISYARDFVTRNRLVRLGIRSALTGANPDLSFLLIASTNLLKGCCLLFPVACCL